MDVRLTILQWCYVDVAWSYIPAFNEIINLTFSRETKTEGKRWPKGVGISAPVSLSPRIVRYKKTVVDMLTFEFKHFVQGWNAAFYLNCFQPRVKMDLMFECYGPRIQMMLWTQSPNDAMDPESKWCYGPRVQIMLWTQNPNDAMDPESKKWCYGPRIQMMLWTQNPNDAMDPESKWCYGPRIQMMLWTQNPKDDSYGPRIQMMLWTQNPNAEWFKVKMLII